MEAETEASFQEAEKIADGEDDNGMNHGFEGRILLCISYALTEEEEKEKNGMLELCAG